jgi:hypothetical protein
MRVAAFEELSDVIYAIPTRLSSEELAEGRLCVEGQ